MYYVGIDIGGTFTDIVVMDDRGTIWSSKTSSTPKDPAVGLLEAFRLAGDRIGVGAKELLEKTTYVSHGTTIVTNALLQRKGARVGLITTKGFGDTILITRGTGWWIGLSEEEIVRYSKRRMPIPIVPRTMIKEVSERVDFRGRELVPLDEEEVRRAVRELMGEGVEAIAVCFLWSFKNPEHEKRVKAIIEETAPDVNVSLSSDLMPVIREYERTVTTVFCASLNPVATNYAKGLEKRLGELGFKGLLSFVTCSGGVVLPDEAAERSVDLLYSGPVGGVSGCLYLGELLGHKNIIGTDVGGTSFDACIISDGKPKMTTSKAIGKYLFHLPMIEIESIGAGGGSLVRVEEGRIRVGPESAGADPGPVCYNRGGQTPTVTDADVVLGIIDPDYFLGGTLKISKALAEEAILEKVGKPLGLDVIQAAAGIKKVIDSQMADLLRSMTIAGGYDPRDFVVFAYGGGGPTHCSSYAAELNVKSIIVPSEATVHSAFGALTMPILHTFELSDPMRTSPHFHKASEHFDCERITRNFERMEDQGRSRLKKERVKEKDVVLRRAIDVRYCRQVHELQVPVPNGPVKPEDIDNIISAFERMYAEKYGPESGYREAGVEITTFRLQAIGEIPRPVLKSHPSSSKPLSSALIGEAPIYFHEIEGFAKTTMYDGLKVGPGHEIEGPAIIRYPGTTAVIGAEQKGTVDPYLNVVIELM